MRPVIFVSAGSPLFCSYHLTIMLLITESLSHQGDATVTGAEATIAGGLNSLKND